MKFLSLIRIDQTGLTPERRGQKEKGISAARATSALGWLADQLFLRFQLAELVPPVDLASADNVVALTVAAGAADLALAEAKWRDEDGP